MKKFNIYFYINASVLSFILNYYCFVNCGGAAARGPRYNPRYGAGYASGRSLGASFSPFVPIGRPNVEYIAIPIVKKVTHHHVHHFIPKQRAIGRGFARPLVAGIARPLVGGYASALSGGYGVGAAGGALAVAAPKYKPVLVGVLPADKLCSLTKGAAKVGGAVVGGGGGAAVAADSYGSGGGGYSKRKGDLDSDASGDRQSQYSKRKGDDVSSDKKREYVPSAETVRLFRYLEKLGY